MFEPLSSEEMLEPKLVEIEKQIDVVSRIIATGSSQIRKSKRAAETGAIRDLELAVRELGTIAENLTTECEALRLLAAIDVHLWVRSGGYVQELIEQARDADLTIIESDQKLLCYPSIVQISAAEPAIVVDKKKDKGIRPSYVVAKLKERSLARVKFKADAFLSSLTRAYDLHIARNKRHPGSPVKLVELYDILTILPGSRSYSKAEFARDVYLLDQSAELHTKDGRMLRFSSSATTRGAGLLETVAKGGQVKLYSAISFEVVE